MADYTFMRPYIGVCAYMIDELDPFTILLEISPRHWSTSLIVCLFHEKFYVKRKDYTQNSFSRKVVDFFFVWLRARK